MRIVRPFLIIVSAIIIGGLGFYGYQRWNGTNQRDANPRSPVSTGVTPVMLISPVAVEPPTDSLKGTIRIASGEGWLYPRVSPDLIPLKTGDSIVQGETLWTKEDGTVTLEYPGHVAISMQPKTQIGMVQTLTNGFLIQQASGSASFASKSDKYSTSIRIASTLVELKSGVITIDVDNNAGLVTITQTEGTSKFGIVDEDNTTQIQSLKKGQTAIIHDANGDIEIE